MELLRNVIVVVHLVGFALILGALAETAVRRHYAFTRTAQYGMGLALITGIALIGSWGGYDPNYPKIGTKLALLVILGAVLGMGAARSRKSGAPVPAAMFWLAVALTVAICAVAVIW
jgi:hypothetical protein